MSVTNSPVLVKRLGKDFKALSKEPVVDATAHPREADITVWEGAINMNLPDMPPAPLHFLIHFPKEYPLLPPSVGFSTPWGYEDGASYTVSEGPLIGKYAICLNILGNFAHVHTEWKDKQGEGWSPAYTIASLLINLQSVLQTKIESSRGRLAELKQIHARVMEWKSKNYVPEILAVKAPAPANPFDSVFAGVPAAPTEMKEKCIAFLSSLKEEEKRKEFLAIIEAMTKLNITAAGVVAQPAAPEPPKIDDSIFCWFSQSNYTEAVLGYGIAVEKHGKKTTIFTDGDYISLDAYKVSNVRTFPSKAEFQFFLPAWINENHAANNQAWKDALEDSLKSIGKSLDCDTRTKAILTVFPDLINTMIVKMMDTSSDINASLKIFECIANLWRVFSHLLREKSTPNNTTGEALQLAITSSTDFIAKDSNRRKEKTPNLGWTLAIVSALPEVDFSKFIKAYEEESFLRKILWWKKDGIDCSDANATFVRSEISRNISLFQFTFITQVIGQNTDQLMADLEATNCKIPSKLEAFLGRWKEVSKRMKDAPNWNQFFTELVSMGYPQAAKDAIASSKETFTAYLKSQCDKAATLDGYVPIVRGQGGYNGGGGDYKSGGQGGNYYRGGGGGNYGGGDRGAYAPQDNRGAFARGMDNGARGGGVGNGGRR